MKIREVFNKISLWLLGVWILACTSLTVNTLVPNDKIPWWVNSIIGMLLGIYIITKDFKDE